jgi:hypothetical protein
MSCESKFSNEVNLSCIFDLAREIRQGVNTKVVKDTLWVSGCLVEKFAPSLPTSPEVRPADTEDAIDYLCDAILAYETVSADATSTFDWSVLLPIFLQLAQLLLERLTKPKTPPTSINS